MDKEFFLSNGKEKLLNYKNLLETSIKEEKSVGADHRIDIFLNPVFRNFFTQLDFSGLVEPFDYHAWLEEEKIELESEEILAQADLELLSKIVTTHLRLDRFVEGHLSALMEKGYFLKVLERIEQL